jgi:hypothetical protein
MKQTGRRSEVGRPRVLPRVSSRTQSKETRVNRNPRNQAPGAATGRVDASLVSCSVWLYFGFIGAAAFGAGLILLFDGHTNRAMALAVVVLGGVLAPACWLRAWVIVNGALGEHGAASGPEAARLGRRARDRVELAAWPEVAVPRPSRRH